MKFATLLFIFRFNYYLSVQHFLKKMSEYLIRAKALKQFKSTTYHTHIIFI